MPIELAEECQAPKVLIDPVVVEITPSLQLLNDIVITAVEGGIGYWSQMVKYKWEGLDFPEAVLVDIAEPDPRGTEVKITPQMVQRGIQLALKPDIVHPGSNTGHSVRQALFDDDGGAIDADAADNIIQLGLYGVIRYA